MLCRYIPALRKRVIANDQGSLKFFLLVASTLALFLKSLPFPVEPFFVNTQSWSLYLACWSIYPSRLFDTLPRAPVTMGTTFIPFIFHIFAIFCLSTGAGIFQPQTLLFLFTRIMSGLRASTTWSHCTLMSHSNFILSFFTQPSGTCSYHLNFFSSSYFLHNFQCTIFATLSCLLLYSFCVNFLHSAKMWETVSVCSQQSLQRGESIDY